MNRTRNPQAIAAALVCISAVASAQTTYTFTDGHALNNSWHHQDNWFPTGVPVAGDTAIIGTGLGGLGLTCEIYENDAACKILRIEVLRNNSVLSVKGKTLTLGAVGVETTSIINGGLELTDSAGTQAELALHHWVTFDNDTGGNKGIHGVGDGGRITRASGTKGLRLRGDVRITNSIRPFVTKIRPVPEMVGSAGISMSEPKYIVLSAADTSMLRVD